MTLDDFRQSLNATEPPAGLPLAARWIVVGCQGRLGASPRICQQDEGTEGLWVHAYLHRKEGDEGNTAYWYARAGKPVCREPPDAEWLSIARGLLG